jgi:hypothetical protein
MKSSIAKDLEEIWKRTRFELKSLSGKTLLLTGSTGMFGVWILYLLLYAKEHGISTKNFWFLAEILIVSLTIIRLSLPTLRLTGLQETFEVFNTVERRLTSAFMVLLLQLKRLSSERRIIRSMSP